MLILRTKKELSQAVNEARKSNVIALVPTMGALHEGHLSLVNVAKKKADIVIVSIFINPTQFGKNEDFEAYPKNESQDSKKLEEHGVDILYMPHHEEIYPPNFSTTIHVKKNADILCGEHRAGHFDGVATVVLKLFMQVKPNVAIFGEKDYQQLHIIKQLTNDLDIPIEIISAQIIREDDGLAMSSRNAYLSSEERQIAPEIFITLKMIKNKINSDTSNFNIDEIIKDGKAHLIECGFDSVDYIEIRHADTLERIHDISTNDNIRILVAATLGKTRLIDNIRTYA